MEIVDERNHLLNMLDVERLQELEENTAAPPSSKSAAQTKSSPQSAPAKGDEKKKAKGGKEKKKGEKSNGFKTYLWEQSSRLLCLSVARFWQVVCWYVQSL